MLTLLDLFDKLTIAEPFAELLEQAEVVRADVDARGGAVETELLCGAPINPSDLIELARLTESTYGLKRVKITPRYDSSQLTSENFGIVLSLLFEKDSMYKLYFANSWAKIDGGKITISNVSRPAAVFPEGMCETAIAGIAEVFFGI